MIEIAALGFLLMGLVALVSPRRVTRCVAFTEQPVAAARNEVRAVYGGFGVAMGGLLIACRDYPQWRDGVLLALALALLGMAAGRLVSWGVDRRLDGFPTLFLMAEVGLGIGLLFSL